MLKFHDILTTSPSNFGVSVTHILILSNYWRKMSSECWTLDEKNTVHTQDWFEKYCYQAVPSKENISGLFADFKRGRIDTNDTERHGGPNKTVKPTNTKKKSKNSNRKMKVYKTVDIIKISIHGVYHIFHEILGMRDLCSNWVSLLPTTRSILPKGMWQWVRHGSSTTICSQLSRQRKMKVKQETTLQSTGKLTSSIFWGAHAFIAIDYLKKRKTIDGEYFMVLLVRLEGDIVNKRT